MSRLVIQMFSDSLRPLFVGESPSGEPGVRRGPPLPWPAGTRDDPETWRQFAEPLREFIDALPAPAGQIVVVPFDVDVHVIATRLVPGMREEETLRVRIEVDLGLDPSRGVFLWRPIERRQSAESEWMDACVLRLDDFPLLLVRRLPDLLGRGRIPAELLPYPAAAARAADRLENENAAAYSAILDVGLETSRLVVRRGDIPLFYARFTFGRKSVEERMLTPVAGHETGTDRLDPDQARLILGTLDFSRLDDRISAENNDTSRQVLRWVQIEVERFAREVADELKRARDEYGLEPPAGMVYSESPAVGMDALLAAVTAMPWRNITPQTQAAPDAPVTINPPLLAYGLSARPAEARDEWRPLLRSGTRRGRIAGLAAIVLHATLAVSAGVLLAVWSHALLLRHRAARLQQSRPAQTTPHDASAAPEPVGSDLLRKLSARGERVVRLVQPAVIARDRRVRRFLVALSRFDAPDFVLDQVLIDAGTAENTTPVVAVQGRAGEAARQLRQFIIFLEKLPEVERAAIDDVAVNTDRDLRCRFSLTIQLKTTDER